MEWQFSEFSIVMAISTFIALLVAMLIWERRIFRGGYALVFMMLAVAEWSLTQAIEVSVPDVSTKIMMSKLSYLGIVSVPVLLLLFTMQYTRKDSWLRQLHIYLLWIIPVITVILVMTNEWHLLVWSGFSTRIVTGYVSVIYRHGIWFWVIATFIYSVSFVSAFLLLQAAYQIYRENMTKTAALVTAALLPILANIFYLLGFGWFGTLDCTPVAFSITGAILVGVLFEFRFFNYTSVLRNFMIGNLKDGVLVLGKDNRILDINAAAVKFTGIKHNRPKGRRIQELVEDKTVIDCIQGLNEGQQYNLKSGEMILEIQNIPFRDGLEIDGSLFIMRDVSNEVSVQEELLNKKGMLDVIFDGVPAMIGYISKDSRFLAVNKMYADFYHLTKDDIVGKYVSDILVDQNAYQNAGNYFLEVLQGKQVSFENVFSFADQTKIADIKFVPQFDEDNQVKAVFALIQDITQRKMAEERESKARKLTEALNQAGIAMSSSLEYNQLLRLVLEQIGNVLSIDRAGIMLIQGDQIKLVAVDDGESDEGFERYAYLIEDPLVQNRVLTEKALINSPDVREEYPLLVKSPFDSMMSWMGVPLVVKDEVIGLLSLGSNEVDHFSQEDERVAAVFSHQVAIALENARVFEKMKQMASIDILTGLFNRRHLFSIGETEFERALRYEKNLALIMLDLDHFKKVNDRFGHKAGDLVLQTIAHRISQTRRKIDIIGRYGGEEFVVLLPETSIENAAQAAERLKMAIQETRVPTKKGVIQVTASFGVAQRTLRTTSFEHLLDMADRALYCAKKTGRNRVQVFNESMFEST